ncbi:MAG TPA: Spy/CpxP family protein refolding chaperone [Edaphobacter sp.]|jgi:Spy/CpxP family protein refolding chaperone
MTITMFRKAGMRMAIVALCSGALCALPVMAQDTAPAASAQGAEGHGRRGGDMTAMLTKQLNLTSDQQTQVKGINDDSRSQMMAVRNDTSMSQADKRTKMMDIRKSSDDKIRALLTDEQKTKFDAMQAKMQERMKARRQGAQGGEAAPQ